MFLVKKISIITVGTIAIGLGSVKPVSAASLYAITGLDFRPSDINDSAQVVGQNYLWQNGNVTDLNTLPGANNSNLFARAINNNGAIVGGGLTVNASTATQSTIPNQAFISDGSTITDLPRNYFCTNFCPTITAGDINDSGTVALNYDGRVGLIQQSDGTTTQVLTTRLLFNTAINNQDQVAGTGVFSGSGIKATSFPRRGFIPSTTETNSGLFTTRANDIDDSGNIVGSSQTSLSSPEIATLWEQGTGNLPGVSLGTLGGANSEAFGINNSQQIVGFSTLLDNSTRRAFLWEGGELIDLNSLVDPGIGWELTSAFKINNNGDIIGIGNFNGEQRGFIATAVPEPTSVLVDPSIGWELTSAFEINNNGIGNFNSEQRGFIATAVPEPSSVLGVLGLGLFGLSNLRKRKK